VVQDLREDKGDLVGVHLRTGAARQAMVISRSSPISRLRKTETIITTAAMPTFYRRMIACASAAIIS